MRHEFRYRDVRDERSKLYRLWGEAVVTCIVHRLGCGRPALSIVEPFWDGEYVVTRPVTGGFYLPPGNRIFIQEGLELRELVIVIAHEIRHYWQEMTGKHMASIESRERDALIFTLELDVPWDEAYIFQWIDVQEARAIGMAD